MRAALITALAGPDSVEIKDLLEPVPGAGQVPVDVE